MGLVQSLLLLYNNHFFNEQFAQALLEMLDYGY